MAQTCDSNPYWSTIAANAKSSPDAVALRVIGAQGEEGTPVTYAQLRDGSVGAAALLRGVGVAEGSIVLTAVANTESSVALSIGIARLGAVWAPADQDLTLQQTLRLLELYQPAAAFLTDMNVEAVAAASSAVGDLARTSILKVPSWESLMACLDRQLPAEQPIEDGVAALMLLTSGTTGVPKSVVTPTSTLRKIPGMKLEIQPAGTMVYFGSPAWVSYSFIFLSATSSLNTLILGQGYTKELYFDIVLRHKPSFLFFWPEVVVDFVVLPEEQQRRMASFVKSLSYGGARTPAAALLKLIQALPETAISQGYCSSEFMPMAMLSAEDHAAVRDTTDEAAHARAMRRLESAGKCACPVRIVDEQVEIVSPGAVGSIQVYPSESSHFTCYYKNTAATAAKWTSDGWFITGDLGHLDQDGYLYLDGRDSETIVLLSGDNVYPNEVESVIAELPGVVEVAVVKVVADDKAISEVGAFIRVVEDASLTIADVKEQCCRKLGQTWSHPTHIFIQTEKLPRNRNGKCLKPLLSQMAHTSLKGAAKVGGA